MADRLGLSSEIRELKIGQSFVNPKATGFHTVKYDFKPASVDTNKIATVDVGTNNQVTVTVPHLDGAGVLQTVFKGSQRPYQKECVLIIDRNTGEITLEKLCSNIQVKKTRSESAKPQLPQDKGSDKPTSSSISSRSQTPPMVGQRISNRTKVTSGSRRPDRQITQLPRHSPLQASPNYPSPGRLKSPKTVSINSITSSSTNDSYHPQSTLGSLPLIDDYVPPLPPPVHQHPHPQITITSENGHTHREHGSSGNNHITSSDNENGVGEMSNSSSSCSSDSDSDTDPDATILERAVTRPSSNGFHSASSNGLSSTSMPPSHFLNEDLRLSESESD